MDTKYKPLPVPIPGDYADLLEIDASTIYHVNAGRRRLRDDQVFQILEAVESDPRLAGLTILELRQEITPFLPLLCKLCPREQKLSDKKRDRRAKQ